MRSWLHNTDFVFDKTQSERVLVERLGTAHTVHIQRRAGGQLSVGEVQQKKRRHRLDLGVIRFGCGCIGRRGRLHCEVVHANGLVQPHSVSCFEVRDDCLLCEPIVACLRLRLSKSEAFVPDPHLGWRRLSKPLAGLAKLVEERALAEPRWRLVDAKPAPCVHKLHGVVA